MAGGSRAEIASHFLKSSPPGQFEAVTGFTKALVPELGEEEVAKACQEYCEATLAVVSVPDSDRKVVLHPAGRFAPGEYVDSKTGGGLRVEFGASGPRVTGVSEAIPEDARGPGDLEELRASLATAADEYARRVFVDPSGVHGAGDAFSTKDGTILLAFSGTKPNLRNLWAARWSSVWTVRPTGAETATVEGSVSLHSHFFENGNMQLTGGKEFASADVSKGSSASLAKAILSHIETCEEELHVSLAEMYLSMDAETLKEIRRHRTITGGTFSWNIREVRTKSALRGGK